MDVKPGYKQSEVGVIPEDWHLTTFKEITYKIGSGLTPAGGNKRYKNSGRPFVRSQNIGWGNLLLDDLVFIDEKTHSEFLATELKSKDILLNITGASIGRTSLVNESLIGGNVNQHVCIIRVNSQENVPEFIKSVLLSSLGQRQIESFQAGGNRQGLNFSQIGSIVIVLPPKEEQQAIAEALSDIDSYIESLEQLIAKKQLIKQGVMQELLTGRKRLPGFSGEWEEKELGSIAEVIGGGTPSSSNKSYWGGKINWFTPTEVGYKKYLTSSKRKITEDGLESSSAKLLPKNTVLLTSRAGIGDLGILKVEACTNQGFQSLVPTTGTDSEFLYYLMHIYKNSLLEKSSGSTFLEISPSSVRRTLIAIPKKLEQEAIARTLSDIDFEINQLKKQKQKYNKLKQGMMQELLTGRVRLV